MKKSFVFPLLYLRKHNSVLLLTEKNGEQYKIDIMIIKKFGGKDGYKRNFRVGIQCYLQ